MNKVQNILKYLVFGTLMGLVILGFLVPDGVRAAFENNIWSVAYSKSKISGSTISKTLTSPPQFHSHARLMLARQAVLENDLEGALEYLSPLVEVSDPLALETYAEILYRQEQYLHALEIWKGLGQESALNHAGIELYAQGKLDLSDQVYVILYDINPEQWTRHVVVNLDRQGDHISAIEVLSRTINDFPGSPHLPQWKALLSDEYWHVGNVYRSTQDFSNAENYYLRSLIEDDLNVKTWRSLGRLYLENGREIKEAINCFIKVIALEPGKGNNYIDLAEAYWSDDQPDRSIDTLENALSVVDTIDVALNLKTAYYYEQLDQAEKALELYWEVLKIDGTNTTARQAVERLSTQP